MLKILMILVLLSVVTMGQKGLIVSLTVDSGMGAVSNLVISAIQDSIRHSGSIKVRFDDKKKGLSEQMPWIVALLIGLLTVLANLITSHYLSKRGKEQLNRQVESNERMNEKQIKATVLSANRQKWINELREKMTEFRTLTGRLHLNLDVNHKGKQLSPAEKTEYETKVEELFHHLRMMMKPDELLTNSEEDQNTREFLRLIDSVRCICGLGNTTNEERERLNKIGSDLEELISCSRRIGKNEWEKVKNLS